MPIAKPRPRAHSVLHVDDHAGAQHVRTTILRRAGFEVISASSVEEALRIADTSHASVVLSDVKLPDGSGFQVCREWRLRHPDVPVILISAVYRDEFAKDTGVYCGAAEYLIEPVSAEDLIAAVRRQLSR